MSKSFFSLLTHPEGLPVPIRACMVAALLLMGCDSDPTTSDADLSDVADVGEEVVHEFSWLPVPIDLLWIVDDGPGACSAQSIMREQLAAFLAASSISLGEIHAAVLTTDAARAGVFVSEGPQTPCTDLPACNVTFEPVLVGEDYVDAVTEEVDSGALLADLACQFSVGSAPDASPAQGLESMALAMSPAMLVSRNGGFRRTNGASFGAIFIVNRDDTSPSDLADYESVLQDFAEPGSHERVVVAVLAGGGPEDPTCDFQGGRYAELASRFGQAGTSITTCDLQDGVSEIAAPFLDAMATFCADSVNRCQTASNCPLGQDCNNVGESDGFCGGSSIFVDRQDALGTWSRLRGPTDPSPQYTLNLDDQACTSSVSIRFSVEALPEPGTRMRYGLTHDIAVP